MSVRFDTYSGWSPLCARKLRALRELVGLSQEIFAWVLDCSRSTYLRFEDEDGEPRAPSLPLPRLTEFLRWLGYRPSSSSKLENSGMAGVNTMVCHSSIPSPAVSFADYLERLKELAWKEDACQCPAYARWILSGGPRSEGFPGKLVTEAALQPFVDHIARAWPVAFVDGLSHPAH